MKVHVDDLVRLKPVKVCELSPIGFTSTEGVWYALSDIESIVEPHRTDVSQNQEMKARGDIAAYIRADLAGLPEDLVERLRMVAEGDANGAYSYRPATPLEKEILAWHEQRTGEKE